MENTTTCEIEWNTVIAGFAFLISVVSIIFTYLQFKLQRTHNKKTVKPLGRIRIGDYENNIYVKIENNGTGPLIVKSILIKNDSIETKKSFIDILPNELTERITWTNFTGRYEGRSISAGNTFDLLVWSINDSYKDKTEENIATDRTDLRSQLKNIKMEVTYTDIYGDEEFKDSLDFKEWFGRHDKK